MDFGRDSTCALSLFLRPSRSKRRGALQALAEAGATHDELMAFSGHKQVVTLLRYLNWGGIVGEKEARAAALGAHLAPKPRARQA